MLLICGANFLIFSSTSGERSSPSGKSSSSWMALASEALTSSFSSETMSTSESSSSLPDLALRISAAISVAAACAAYFSSRERLAPIPEIKSSSEPSTACVISSALALIPSWLAPSTASMACFFPVNPLALLTVSNSSSVMTSRLNRISRMNLIVSKGAELNPPARICFVTPPKEECEAA